MKVLKAYRTELDPNGAQRAALVKHAGTARWAYNWGLAQRTHEYRMTGGSVSVYQLQKRLAARKRDDLVWLYEVSKYVPEAAFRDLEKAFQLFWLARKRGRRVGFPRFKSRKRRLGSFRLYGRIRVFPDRIQLPSLGRIRLKERGYLPLSGARIVSATVSERAGRWYVSLHVEEEIAQPQNMGPAVGIDVGVRQWAMLSDGVVIERPNSFHQFARRLARAQRALSRKRPGSRNRERAASCVTRLHRKIADHRADALHKTTIRLAKTKSVIVVEDLSVRSLLGRRSLSHALSDAGLREFRRQLEYKTRWYGGLLLVAPRRFPSTRRCSCAGCGAEKAIPLDERVFQCDECGCSRDRDLNAARNLLTLAVGSTDTENACGGGVRPPAWRLPPEKQEPATYSDG